jgi:hypothetical protein
LNSGESTPKESARGKFETFEARKVEEIHSHHSMGQHVSVDHGLWVKSFWEEASE